MSSAALPSERALYKDHRFVLPFSCETARLFKPVQLAGKQIHRVGLAPLTRMRASAGAQVPRNPMVAEYYTQRASEGGFLVTEATFIAHEAGGYPLAPGIYSQEQIDAWKEVTSAVHAKGSTIALQLWALGRANNDPFGAGKYVKTVAPSPVPINEGEPLPEELSIDDIKRYIGHYRQAARNAMEAGFDLVEIHGANGYLIDQFTQYNSNKRTDAYGGPIENRTRFALEVIEAVVAEVGQEKVGFRISPWGTFQGMQEADPLKTFSYLVQKIVDTYPKFGYVHMTEGVEWHPGAFDTKNLAEGVIPGNDPLRAIVRGIEPSSIKNDHSTVFPEPTPERPTLVISASGFKPDNVYNHVERTGDVICFGRLFIANPDLPYRLKNHVELNAYDRNTFYTQDAAGYTDYPFANEESKSGKAHL
ncbi:NADH:flavin oxidoreductase/12-oxophytodienoate reductase [Phaffia rhodozyma]|uniref:NADH:flavin oxidoreductase/12-oxophytodienoate reductase n=1 Tax=Phaffia rhodozyma TaxID=264483 RepID=A0A0F7SNM4_PHARH|nr:NADH:flavin oxidoreductase/12-oxophytodienoate reductase [Phaffia rhodozyma]